MKLLTQGEIDSHFYATAGGGLKGLCAGLLVTGAIFKIGAKKIPNFPKNLPWSIRTAIFISPPTVGITIGAEEASNAFDRDMYSGDYESQLKLAEYQKWSNLPLSEKLLSGVVNNKYKIIVGSWAASMYGSWLYVDRDPIMTRAQKLVQARMYAQFLSVILLLAGMGLTIYDEEKHPENYGEQKNDDWKRILAEEEIRAKEDKKAEPGTYKRVNIYKTSDSSSSSS
ncbi:Altered inheritance rate of mitochondria protein 38 [Wickerhamomyces ciferrii]|uniref:Altered inheritance rate of mitochondria protein 38 n=1 Tax=Wickerhamomyces ciferrii (strain ATCC 14091 / BCRC 22168 / CBS 111 / JCM 3599 / NBRC 0793 / NRRL Y-1031 F-60-10) TaxID=1206466 RepID=K0KNV6_WICCF|nr:Altered inheritance rate of mitochondria protein 38 [Wickerhamomyces ciferrii]CCH42773.1 Altered inheritance rate of mitochondria protein 38 [Wickerhamomyces ciferrii]